MSAPGTYSGSAARRALASRLRSVAPIILDRPLTLPLDLDPAADAAAVLDLLSSAIATNPTKPKVWLLLTALSAAFPTRGEINDARRRFELDDALTVSLYLLDSSLQRAIEVGEPLAELDIVESAVIVDVDHTARFNLHTGIQRVVRQLMPEWQRDHDVLAVVWNADGGALRTLTEREAERTFRWADRGDAGEGAGSPDRWPAEPTLRLVVPWRSVIVLAEVPPAMTSDRLAGLGASSGNRVVGIGYDTIPVVSADLVPPVESAKFVRYLTAVKFASRMACISAAATAELRGFVEMLPTQGLLGPVVSEVSLPSPATPDRVAPPKQNPPMVLVVGSHEPRKNHLAVLYAAEVLWREGLDFSLHFIGGSGWGEDFPRRAADLARAGRKIQVHKAVDDQLLDEAYDQAAFTVFPSLHEGYGLPVAESLTHGTPVITSNFGSTAEIAVGGGVVTVDPRDDEAIVGAMRSLLVDGTTLADLRLQIAERKSRTWDEYAATLWDVLIMPELTSFAARGPSVAPLLRSVGT